MTSAEPTILAFAEAVRVIAAEAEAHRRARGGRVVVGVTGAVASGKSTFARMLAAEADSGCRTVVLSTDHYLPDYDRTPEHLRDLPESSDLDRLARDLMELREGRAARMPQWSFESHSRVGEREIGPAELVVVEGLHALHATARAHVDLGVFVDAPRDVRWARAVERERAGDRPWPLEYLAHFFENVAEPTYALHRERYRQGAHWIVENR